MPRVLIIDDDQGTLDTDSAILRLEGFETATATSGRSGIALALTRPFDVLLVDLRLQDISGVEVVQELKACGVSTPMVIVTAFPTADSAIDADAVGAAGYIEGLLLADELVDVVLQALKGQFPVQHPDHRSAPQAIRVVLRPHPLTAADPRLRDIVRMIDSQLGEPLSVGRLAARVNLSESRLRHMFRATVGLPISQFVAHRRVRMGARLLATTYEQVRQVAYAVGANDLRRFRKAFRRRFDMSPKVYQARYGGRGTRRQ